ncbi:unnamed protein product [Polarella glacialis]|uniref:UBA domain-containing protein n=1 Tax=Polarella glacialis TaxID=89957 RepID=A0A813D1Y1_POLGL|nr:unnamed protein product [Polarella glacialis]
MGQLEDSLRNLTSQHEGSERRLQQIERKDKLAKPREAKNTVDPGLEDTVCHLATGVIKLAQLLGATSEDTCEKLGWREACADLPRMVDHTWLRCRLPKRASILKLLRQKADSETVREIQARLDELLVRGFEGSKKETSSATQYSPEEGYQQPPQHVSPQQLLCFSGLCSSFKTNCLSGATGFRLADSWNPSVRNLILGWQRPSRSGAEGLALSKQAHRLGAMLECSGCFVSASALHFTCGSAEVHLRGDGLPLLSAPPRSLGRGSRQAPSAVRSPAPRGFSAESPKARCRDGQPLYDLTVLAGSAHAGGCRCRTCRTGFYSQLAMIKKNRNATGLFMLSAAVQSEESVDGEGAPENWAWSEELWIPFVHGCVFWILGFIRAAIDVGQTPTRQRRSVELAQANFEASKDSFQSVPVPGTFKLHIKVGIPCESRQIHPAADLLISSVKKIRATEVDRHVFEWLYILEEYRGDILDSSLQTLKYLEYEFFASAAHSMSTCLPSRMEFRPMVEMTPAHLETQVEMELAESEDGSTPATGSEAPIVDFSIRLIEKKAKETSADESPVLSVDPLSLSSLLSQGFEEGPARRALRLNNNNTQDAMDWLINGCQEEDKTKLVSEGVRMPTTVHRVLKLKAMKKAQRDKEKFRGSSGRGEKDDDESSPGKPPASPQDSKTRSGAASPDRIAPVAPVRQQPQDLLSMDEAPSAKSNGADSLLLSFDDDQPALPTDFSKPVERTALPAHVEFDLTRCEKPPLASAVAAGVAQPRAGSVTTSSGWPSTDSSQDALAAIQALAAQSGISAEQLLLAAQQLQSGGGERVSSLAASSVPASMQALAPSIAASPFGGYPGTFDLAVGRPPEIGLEPSVSDPFGFQQPVAQPSSTESPSKPKDSFGDLTGFAL